MKIVEMFFDEDNDMLVLEEPDGTISRFNHLLYVWAKPHLKFMILYHHI